MSPNIVNVSRRRFLKVTATAGAGLSLGVYLPTALAQEGSGPGKTGELFNEGHFEPNAFVRIDSDDTVRVIIKHLEMGQGTYTGLSTLVAEELDAAWEQVVPEAAPADSARYNNLFWGPFQGTGGSTAMANSFEQMRKAGAAARHMLVAAAAEAWQVPVGEISISQGVVSHAATGQKSGFGALAEAAARQTVPEKPVLKDPKNFVFIGKRVPRKDTGKVNGTALYTQDVKLDGLLTAVVAHAPRFGAKVAAFDTSKAEAIPGVVSVVQIASGVAVLAEDFWSPKKGRDALEIEWDESQAFKLGSAEIMASYKELAKQPGLSVRRDGDPEQALK